MLIFIKLQSTLEAHKRFNIKLFQHNQKICMYLEYISNKVEYESSLMYEM